MPERTTKTSTFAGSLEPSSGLEPETPSLPFWATATGRNQRQRFSLTFAVLGSPDLPPIATGCNRWAP